MSRGLKEVGVLAVWEESSSPQGSQRRDLEVGGCLEFLRGSEEPLWLE